MTSYDKKLKKSYAGEDIAGIFHEEEAAKEKGFKKQKSKNSELLASFRAKMSDIRSDDDDPNFDMEIDSFNLDKDDRLNFDDNNKENSAQNNQKGRSEKKKFSFKRPFFNRKKGNNTRNQNQQRRKKPSKNNQHKRNRRY